MTRIRLAPLEPDAFLRWSCESGSPVTCSDVWFEWVVGDPDLRLESVRKHYVRMAARVRRQQRLGLDPWAFVLPWRG